jgi:TPR repeat protein
MFYYATWLEQGIGVAKDPQAASEWFRRSARGGYPPAIGWCTRNGRRSLAKPPEGLRESRESGFSVCRCRSLRKKVRRDALLTSADEPAV